MGLIRTLKHKEEVYIIPIEIPKEESIIVIKNLRKHARIYISTQLNSYKSSPQEAIHKELIIRTGETVKLFPVNGKRDIISVMNLSGSERKINFDAPQEYHIAPEQHVKQAGGLEKYLQAENGRKK